LAYQEAMLEDHDANLRNLGELVQFFYSAMGYFFNFSLLKILFVFLFYFATEKH